MPKKQKKKKKRKKKKEKRKQKLKNHVVYKAKGFLVLVTFFISIS
jgi:hypothetical protein